MRAIMAMKQVVEPMFEARNDYDIFAGIAKRLGKEKEFTEGKSEMDWIRSFYDAALSQAKSKKIEMPAFDAFWSGAGVVEFPIPAAAKTFVRHGKFREDPLLNPLGTPSGKIEIYSREHREDGLCRLPAAPHLDGAGRTARWTHDQGATSYCQQSFKRAPALTTLWHDHARHLRHCRA